MKYKIPHRLAALLAALSLAIAAVAASHPLNIPGADKTHVGIYIEDLRDGKVAATVNADELFIPASVLKSLTSATVLCDLVPDGRFVTPVEAVGRVKDGVLDGNIVVRAVGDPTIESRHFERFNGFADSVASALKREGITRVNGKVIIDESRFPDATAPQGWQATDLTSWYGAFPHGANYSGNLEGRTPVKNPSAMMQNAIVHACNNAGLEILQKAVEPDTKRVRTLYAHRSPRVDQILSSLMKRSDNMMAEAMLRILEPGCPRSEAIAYEMKFWNAKGFDFSGISIYDGSGLSRDNRMSPRFIADLLRWMYRSSNRVAYSDLFPRAGREGTMRNMLKDTRLEGRLALKTGSMNGVQCYAGYLVDDVGAPTHMVVVMVNDFTCDRGVLKNRICDYLLEKLP